MVFVPREYFVTPEQEKARYDLHRNEPTDIGYVNFLSRLMGPIRERLKPGSRGLDFGSGPGPVLREMFKKAGYPMEIYDPFYAPDKSVLDRQYDFVTATEVFEHLREPTETLKRIWATVRPGGWLGVMTQPLPPKEAFSRWSYKSDPTHILFFSPRVFKWLAFRWNAKCITADKNIFLIGKSVSHGKSRI